MVFGYVQQNRRIQKHKQFKSKGTTGLVFTIFTVKDASTVYQNKSPGISKKGGHRFWCRYVQNGVWEIGDNRDWSRHCFLKIGYGRNMKE